MEVTTLHNIFTEVAAHHLYYIQVVRTKSWIIRPSPKDGVMEDCHYQRDYGTTGNCLN